MPPQRNPRTLACFLLLVATSAFAASPTTIPGLGTTTFATSTKSPEAQTAFMRGFLLLHLFEYRDAATAFISAEKLDPTFAMAYWGEAMTANHGVWNQVNPAAGKAALAKLASTPEARAALIADPREKAYIAAVEILFDSTGTKSGRDHRYAKAMEDLAAAYPADRDAQLFYALALLSQSEGVRDIPVYLHAAEISKAIYQLEPNNPGAAHYWIHGMDDPAHAAGALTAARTLSKIAPDAPHALHMCSHIFMALGMWDDVVAANLEAVRVGDLQDKAAGMPPYNCDHYPDWLEYGYFQQGRPHDARQVAAACRQTDTEMVAFAAAHADHFPHGSTRMHAHLTNAATTMRDRAIIESQIWTAPIEPSTPILEPDTAAWHNFVLGYAAAQRADIPTATAALEAMRSAIATFRADPGTDPQDLPPLLIATGELTGLIQIKSNHYEAGLAELRQSVTTYNAMPFDFGPPETLKPPDELLAEVLLAHGDPTAARHAFEQSLTRAPQRTQSLLGLARAQHQAGDEAASRKTYQLLLTLWHNAEPDTPGLAEARKAAAKS